jgi:SAM-dependent methyltransferase
MTDWLSPGVVRRLAAFGIGRKYACRTGRANEVMNSFPGQLQGTVMEIGAGANGPIFSAALGKRYQALDLGSSYKARTAEDHEAVDHRVDLEAGPLPFADQEFDVVLCLDVIEHVDDPHAVFRELFRIARRHVIVSLPNNWPHMYWSLLYGRNITHTAGYGLGAKPKTPGQRHKHFFNLEEACRFLLGAAPDNFSCVNLAFRFEYGSDGLLATFPPATTFFRVAGKVTVSDARSRYGVLGAPLWLAAKIAYAPLRLLDLLLTGIVYGWGNPIRYYNSGCRQVWAVFERRDAPIPKPAETPPGR